MSPRAIALAITFAIVLLGAGIGFCAGRRRTMNLEQWTVGGRAFGTFLMWLLMAGEIYTAFSFLGVSGWAYSRVGPVLYVLAFMILANVVCFFIFPPVWELGRRYGLQTLPDFFHVRYANRHLAAFVAMVGIIFMIPYLELQITGLGIIVEVSSFGGIGRTQAMVIAVVLMVSFLLASGVRAVAWVSVLKDFLMIAAVASIGIWIPHHYFGGASHMFSTLSRVHPEHLTMPGATSNLGHAWYISTVLLSALGGSVWPHYFGASFTARSGDILRRNAIVLPFYALSYGFLFIAGFAALLIVPGLKDGDLSLLTVVRQVFPAWMLGLIGGAGALTAMVLAAVLLLSASTLFAKNLLRPILAPGMSDDRVARIAKITVVALGLISLYFAVYGSSSLVSLLLLGYAGVTQFFPGVCLGLFWKRVSTVGVFSGMVAGVGLTAALLLSGRDPLAGLNAGFLALCANFAVTVLVSLWSPASASLIEKVPVAVAPLS
jgi:SSS family solute:Na+ symporter